MYLYTPYICTRITPPLTYPPPPPHPPSHTQIRGCIHVSLLALYGLGGYLVHRQLLPISALLTGIGFTYSLVYATQGIVQTSADLRRLMVTVNRYLLGGVEVVVMVV